MKIRLLKEEEFQLIEFLLKEKPDAKKYTSNLKIQLVEEMYDGGMGSLKFVSNKPERKFGKELAVCLFKDEDGVPVSIAINIDNYDELYELDVWKVDFSPLIRFPRID